MGENERSNGETTRNDDGEADRVRRAREEKRGKKTKTTRSWMNLGPRCRPVVCSASPLDSSLPLKLILILILDGVVDLVLLWMDGADTKQLVCSRTRRNVTQQTPKTPDKTGRASTLSAQEDERWHACGSCDSD